MRRLLLGLNVLAIVLLASWFAMDVRQLNNAAVLADVSTPAPILENSHVFAENIDHTDLNQVLAGINAAREQAGVPHLMSDQNLNKAAQKRVDDMARQEYYSHTSPSGMTFVDLLQQQGVDYQASCENLSMEFTTNPSRHTNAWLNSRSHRGCVLGNYSQIGLATLPMPGTYSQNQRAHVVVAIFIR